MKCIKRGMAAMACIMLLLSMTIPAMAADTTADLARKGSVSITLKDSAEPHAIIKGASFRLYQVGTAFPENGTLCFSLTDDFSGSNISLRDLRADGLAAHLYAYAQQQGISGMRVTADADGHVLFENLQTGLYLAVQDGSISGYYAIKPFLISIPMTGTDGAGWLYDIQANPKTEAMPGSQPSGTTSLTVEKQWNHGGHAAPDSVTVALLCDGKIYDKQVLRAENQWSHKWTKLDKDYSWTAVELEIPEGYQVSYSSVGKKVVITNTYVPMIPNSAPAPSPIQPDDPSVPDGPTLIQTGQLNWPIPVLAAVGMVLFLTGWGMKQKGKPSNEK